MCQNMPVRSPDIIREQILELHGTRGLSYRAIARNGHFGNVPAGTLCAIANGYPIPKRWHEDLGLEIVANVVVMHGKVSNGAQSIGETICSRCGKAFISNHPRRSKCFTCSPYRGKKGLPQ